MAWGRKARRCCARTRANTPATGWKAARCGAASSRRTSCLWRRTLRRVLRTWTAWSGRSATSLFAAALKMLFEQLGGALPWMLVRGLNLRSMAGPGWFREGGFDGRMAWFKGDDGAQPGQIPVPDLQLSELNGGARLQPSRRHPDSARRTCRRNDRASSGTDRTGESV